MNYEGVTTAARNVVHADDLKIAGRKTLSESI